MDFATSSRTVGATSVTNGSIERITLSCVITPTVILEEEAVVPEELVLEEDPVVDPQARSPGVTGLLGGRPPSL
jgi:hypothetical protein